MKTKNMLLNFSISILSILFIMLLLELCLIVFDYEPLKPLLKDPGQRHLILQRSSNKDIIYEPVPLAQRRAWGCDVEINSWGFRDKEYDPKKGNHYRIIAIGDSITFGNRLPLSRTYAKQLEEMFEKKGRIVDVLNMGLGGYNANQAIGFLQEKGLKFSPDTVVYGYCLNDIMDGSPNLDFINQQEFLTHASLLKFRLGQFIALQIYQIKSMINLANEIRAVQSKATQKTSYSRLIDKEEHVIFQSIKQIKILRSRYKKLPYCLNHYLSLDRIGLLRTAFDKLKRMADSNNFDVVIVIIPYLEKKNNEYLFSPAHRIVEYEAKRHHFVVIDMFEKMDANGLSRLKMDGVHPNAQGHEMIARALYDYFMLNEDL